MTRPKIPVQSAGIAGARTAPGAAILLTGVAPGLVRAHRPEIGTGLPLGHVETCRPGRAGATSRSLVATARRGGKGPIGVVPPGRIALLAWLVVVTAGTSGVARG